MHGQAKGCMSIRVAVESCQVWPRLLVPTTLTLADTSKAISVSHFDVGHLFGLAGAGQAKVVMLFALQHLASWPDGWRLAAITKRYEWAEIAKN